MAAARDDTRSEMDIDNEASASPAGPSNGINGDAAQSPTPPPHKASPSAAATADADAFKLAGNKFFKNGEYFRAIHEYNKGGFLKFTK